MPFFAVRKKFPFSQTKSFLFTESLRTALKSCPFTYKSSSFAQAFPCRFQKPPIFLQTKSFSFAQTFPYYYPKQPFSTLRFPFQRPLTYCLQKNTALLFHFALNPYAVKPERRTDSNHCRRYPENLPFSALPVT